MNTFVNQLNLPKGAIADGLGTSSTQISRWLHENESLSTKLLIYLTRNHDLNANWLITGKGLPTRSQEGRVAETESDYAVSDIDRIVISSGPHVAVGNIHWEYGSEHLRERAIGRGKVRNQEDYGESVENNCNNAQDIVGGGD